MATPTKLNNRIGTHVLKTFKDEFESFRGARAAAIAASPALALQPLLPLLDQANQALGRLDGLASILPDPSLFILSEKLVLFDRGDDPRSFLSAVAQASATQYHAVGVEVQSRWNRAAILVSVLEAFGRILPPSSFTANKVLLS